jgi:hypothetical protein
LAFAVTDLNRQHAAGDLGPEYFYQATIHRIPGWKPGQGLQASAAIDASKLGHPLESAFPYQNNEPTIPFTALPTSLKLHGQPVTFFKADVAQLISNIDAGVPTGVALRLTREFYSPVDGLIPFSAAVLPAPMIHAVVVVGLGHDSQGDPWFYIRNSWGVSWGQDGHAWIPAAYINAHAACAFGV